MSFQNGSTPARTGSHFAPSGAPSSVPGGIPDGIPGNEAPQKPRRKRNIPLIVAGVIAGILAVAYIAGVAVFSFIYYPGTSIVGTDVSLLTAGAAAERIEAATPVYSFKVEGEDFSWEYAPQSIDDLIDVEAVTDKTLRENSPFAWPARLFEAQFGSTAQKEDAAEDSASEPDFSTFSSSFDEAAFEEELGAQIDAYNEGRSGLFEPATTFDEETGSFSLERAQACQKLDRESVIAFAKLKLSQLSAGASLDELGDSAYLPLADGMTDDDIAAACDAMNELLGVDATLTMGGADVAKLSGADVAQWVVLDEKLTPSIDEDAVSAWVEKLADELDTAGTERTYTRADGKEVTTAANGDFGWVVDREALAKTVSDAVAKKQTGEIAVPTSQEGDTYAGKGKRDWGSYIDIDLTEQYARYYDADDNIIWESGVITGNPHTEHSTTKGVYILNAMYQNITLTGAIDPATGEPEYKTPVKYWMSFIGSAVGLHDADWQPSWAFGDPDAYESIGSHGCVNLPPSKAAELYDILEVGTCVIVHE